MPSFFKFTLPVNSVVFFIDPKKLVTSFVSLPLSFESILLIGILNSTLLMASIGVFALVLPVKLIVLNLPFTGIFSVNL